MYKVKDKRTGEIVTVYALNGTMFLLFNGFEWYYDDIKNYEPADGGDSAAVTAIYKIAEGGHTWMCPYCKNAEHIYSGQCDCALGTGVCRPPFDKFEWRGGRLEDSYYDEA